MEQKYCQLCEDGDPSINVFCRHCGQIMHLHHKQIDMVDPAAVLLADCPECQKQNQFVRIGGRILPVKLERVGELPVTDLRGSR